MRIQPIHLDAQALPEDRERPALEVRGGSDRRRDVAPQASGSCPTTATALGTLMQRGGTVTLSCSSPTTISLTGGISITSGVTSTLNASQSPAQITLDGGHTAGGTNGTQLFGVASGASLTLNSLTLQHGYFTRTMAARSSTSAPSR
jgi:hypothetical protein